MDSAQNVVTEFWERDVAGKDQWFYTASCLIEASASNYAVGKFLVLRRVHDWASTAFYYSALYAARLIVFLGDMDFPTGHSKIGSLFDGEAIQDRAWFLSTLEKLNYTTSSRTTFRWETTRTKLLAQGVSEHMADAACRAFHGVLPTATELRNDSSYESLLIAHQYSHKLVTEAFRQLVKHFETLSRGTLQIAATVLAEIAKAHSRGNYFRAFLEDSKNREGFYYLEEQLNDRFPPEIVRTTLDLLRPLKEVSRSDPRLADAFHENITIEAFDTKRELMTRFQKDIDSLGCALEADRV